MCLERDRQARILLSERVLAGAREEARMEARAAAERREQAMLRIHAEEEARVRAAYLEDLAWSPFRTLQGYWLTPPLPGEISSRFGPRLHPILDVVRLHRGVDIGAVHGTEVAGVAPGEVVQAGERGGYGLSVEIQHNAGYSTLYAHLSVIEVSLGERVHRGEILGRVGSTGLSTGPHLHFEVRRGGEPIDPAPLLPVLRDAEP